MKSLLTAFVSLSLFACAAAYADPINTQTVITRGSQAAYDGPTEFFTGNVKVQPLFSVSSATNVSGAYVTFDAGARSAWHTHPAGQTLIVTEGIRWAQVWGGEVQDIHQGDVIVCPPGVKHWHGASPGSNMTHLTITGDKDGQNVDWLEKVSDEQYTK